MIVFGYLWPNQYYKIEEDLIVCTPSRGSSATGSITPVDPLSPELAEVPLPPSPIPEVPNILGITDFNRRTEIFCQRIEAHNSQLKELPLTPEQRLESLLARIRSGEISDEVAFSEGNITYRQLWRIDQSANPHFYTKASIQRDADYKPPCVEESGPQGEEEEEEEEEECPLLIPDPMGTHSEIPHLEHNSQEQSLESLRTSLDEHLGTIIEEMFQFPKSE